MITITLDTKLISEEAWDYPVEEIGYLLEEHDGETFVYNNGRLFETEV